MYRRLLATLLSDAQRSGTPPTITEAQKAQILALAAEKPETASIPITHWTCSTLRQAYYYRPVVNETEEARLKPHLVACMRYTHICCME